MSTLRTILSDWIKDADEKGILDREIELYTRDRCMRLFTPDDESIYLVIKNVNGDAKSKTYLRD